MDGRAPPGAMTHRKLLATRVLSVDAYWQEMRDARGRPGRDREIPVPLWPGESLQQYEREFARWLSARRLSLYDMREDPVAERNYRLQYAQTRVTRPVEAQRPPPRSRSRSRSPSKSGSPPRRYAGVQERQPPRYNPVTRREHDSRVYSLEKRPSPDNGRPFATRQPGDRQRQDRSYSRERPQQVRHSAAPGVPQAYDHWQPPRGAEPRPRQDPRVPPPRDAQRQYAADGQHWSKSPSRSPQYGRAASPSRSDRSSSSQVHRSASPQHSFGQGRSNPETMRRQLLARRVISVDAFRDEMYKLHNGFIREEDLKRPHETMVRIPVLLWPGETMAQYTQKFERWLESRCVSLPSLRDNPAKERSLWHSFAYTRAGTSDLGGDPARPKARARSPPPRRSRSRSRSRSSSRSARRSSERGRPPMPAGYDKLREIPSNAAPSGRPHFREPEQRRRSRSPPPSIAPPENPRLFTNKTRRQLLERRIIALDVFQKEVEQNAVVGANVTAGDVLPAIPVPLYPGESMGLYDHRFWTWLKDFDETKDALRGNPSRERRFRIAFAYLRVSRPQESTTASDRSAGTQQAQDPRPNVESHAKLPIDVLKSARDRLVMNAKRHADEMERKAQAPRESPESKRVRVDVEGKGSTHASANVPLNRQPSDPRHRITSSLPPPPPDHRHRITPSFPPPPPDHRHRITPSFPPPPPDPRHRITPSFPPPPPDSRHRITPSFPPPPPDPYRSRSSFTATRLAPSNLVPTSAPSTASLAATRSVGTPTPSQVLQEVSPAAASLAPTGLASYSRPSQTTPAGVFSRVHPFHVTAPTHPAQRTLIARPAPAPVQSSTAPSHDTQVQTAAAVSKSSTTSTPAAPHSSMTPVQTVVTSSQTAAGTAMLNADVYSSAVYRTEEKPESRTTTAKPVQAAPRSLPMSWNMNAPRSATSPEAPNPAAFSATATVARALTPPATVASTAAPLRKIAPAKSATTNTTADVVQSASSSDDAVFEPETTPAESHEVSDAESNPADGSEDHDGDVMNPDGCCCTKCMRSWAKTLTDSMDRLEQNVMDLKNQVVNPGTVKSSY